MVLIQGGTAMGVFVCVSRYSKLSTAETGLLLMRALSILEAPSQQIVALKRRLAHTSVRHPVASTACAVYYGIRNESRKR